MDIDVGSLTTNVSVNELVSLSVTVTVYVPPAMPLRSSVVAPVFQANVYGVVPPATVRSMEPLESPPQAKIRYYVCNREHNAACVDDKCGGVCTSVGVCYRHCICTDG